MGKRSVILNTSFKVFQTDSHMVLTTNDLSITAHATSAQYIFLSFLWSPISTLATGLHLCRTFTLWVTRFETFIRMHAVAYVIVVQSYQGPRVMFVLIFLCLLSSGTGCHHGEAEKFQHGRPHPDPAGWRGRRAIPVLLQLQSRQESSRLHPARRSRYGYLSLL